MELSTETANPQPLQPDRKSRSLFHYTTAQGLIGIVKDQSIFATHADFSNDTSECKLALPIIAKTIEAELRKIVPGLIAVGAFSEDLRKDYGESFYQLEARNAVGALLKATNNVSPYFITSFCIHDPDTYEYQNGLLSQWRSYARGGFAIEFDELAIDHLNNLERKNWRYQGFITNTVEYKNHEAKTKPKQFEGMARAMLRRIIAKKSQAIEDILGAYAVEDYAHAFLTTAPFLKHPGFEEEREYRVVALCNRKGKVVEGDQRAQKDILFRSRESGNVIPYIALYGGLEEKLPIKAIVVGPHAQQENQAMAVSLLLEQHDVKAKVRRSEIPFRE